MEFTEKVGLVSKKYWTLIKEEFGILSHLAFVLLIQIFLLSDILLEYGIIGRLTEMSDESGKLRISSWKSNESCFEMGTSEHEISIWVFE